MKILSLDMSTVATGWAIINSDNKDIRYGVFRGNKKDDIINRFRYMMEEIDKLITDDIDVVICEDVFLLQTSNPDVMKKLCILQGIVTSLTFKKNKDLTVLKPGEWREMVGLHKSIFTCKKCGESFENISSLPNPICSKCGNDKKTTFSKKSINGREELKQRAVDECNKRFDTNFVYSKTKESDDDTAEAIMMGLGFIERRIKNGL